MSAWSSGYVADIEYTHGFYRELTPAILRLAAAVRGDASARKAPVTYCELGCGQGFSTNLLAAANPEISFYATDFNPAQIAGAQALAEAGGARNIRFFDQSFEDFIKEPSLPQFDVIALHGIYSWVDETVRRAIVTFINARLKPGGTVYVSYNSLPGWAPAAPMRHLLYLHGKSTGGPTGTRLEPALAFVSKLAATGASYFRATPGLAQRLEKLKEQNRNYLAHEYFNDAWTLLYHGDVATEMNRARLSFVGTAHLLDHIDAIHLTADQQSLLAEISDPVFRETTRDFIVNQQFRRDIFVRGARMMEADVVRELWLAQRFVLSADKADIPLKVAGALGEGSLQRDVYEPLIAAFAGRSAAVSLRQFCAEHPEVAALGWAKIQQALLILCGVGHLQPCPLDEKSEPKRRESAKRFNQAVIAKARHSATLQFLASPVTGGGIHVDRFQQLFILAAAQNAGDAPDFVWKILQDQDQRLIKDGVVLDTPEQNLAELGARFEVFAKRAPVLKRLGII